jgi:precorrin-6A/cobalt-precorrin-6A reductase
MPSSPMPTMDSHRCGVVLLTRCGNSETLMRILILGGTSEASELARWLGGDRRFVATLSLAGRTAAPSLSPIATRSGGFGGVDGLVQWVKDNRIEAIVDATHPFATRISANAVAATGIVRLPLLSLVRPPWRQQDEDKWIRVSNADEARAALGEKPRRVFLSIGRQEISAFRAAPQHSYLVRSIEPPATDALPPHAELILQRGPFEPEAEIALLRAHAIEFVVAKNSGSDATYAKIAAARALGLPVVMIEQPEKPHSNMSGDIDFICKELASLTGDHVGALSERGV